MSTSVISFINLKGGVAKTTTTVGLGEFLSGIHNKKVLIIDLDPQTNATTVLIGPERWLELDKQGHTIATLFSDAIYGEKKFELEKTLQKSVGNIAEANTLDLLPSSLELIELQDRLITMPSGQFGTRNPVTILLRGIRSILNDYDFVLIDCPPNLGYITLNGLAISNGYIIPTIPDILSTYGIPQIVTRINTFSEERSQEGNNKIIPLGIVATKVRSQTNLHKNTLNRMRNNVGKVMAENLIYPNVFETEFPDKISISQAADYQDNKITLKSKWQSAPYETFRKFAEEFINVCKEI